MKAPPSIRLIAEASAEVFGVRYIDIMSTRRNADIVRARHVACYLARKLTLASLPMIGKALGKDHTTVLHGVAQIEQAVLTDPDMRDRVDEVEAAIAAVSDILERAHFRERGAPVPREVAQRILDDPRGATSISIAEIVTLASAVLSAPSDEQPDRAPLPDQPIEGALAAAGRELLAALTALDNVSYDTRGAITAARQRLAHARADLCNLLKTSSKPLGDRLNASLDAHA